MECQGDSLINGPSQCGAKMAMMCYSQKIASSYVYTSSVPVHNSLLHIGMQMLEYTCMSLNFIDILMSS